jgi:hypothetical protein
MERCVFPMLLYEGVGAGVDVDVSRHSYLNHTTPDPIRE